MGIPKGPRYPGQIPTIPSQRLTGGVPYSDQRQPDIEQFREYRQAMPVGYPHREAYVMPNWESRPINATDFIAAPPKQSSNPANILIEQWDYIVPDGRTAFLRTVDFYFYPITDVASPSTPPDAVDVNGRSCFEYTGQNEVFASLLLDGSAIDQQSRISIKDWLTSYAAWEVYLIAGQGSTISFQLQYVRDGGTTLWTAELASNAILYGNLLLSSGSDAQLQAGNEMPLPVRTASKAEIDVLRGQGVR